jgi:DNA polymerase-3 subunit beta
MSEVKTRQPRAKKAAASAAPAAPAVTLDIKVTNRAFGETLTRARDLIARATVLPILKCVALTVGGGSMTVESSNLEQALRQTTPIAGMGSGGGCVDAERLSAVIARLPPDEETTLEFSPAALLIRCGAVKVTLTSWPLSDFPVFAVRDERRTAFAMSAATLVTALRRVSWAMSEEQTRFYLCGVSLNVAGEGEAARLRACATNGNDMALARMPLPEGADGMPAIIVPSPAVEELEKVLKNADIVDLTISEAALVAEIGGTVFLTKLIAASFPNYDRIIPEPAGRKFSVAGAELVRVTRLASLFSKSEKVKPWARLNLSAERAVVFAGEGNDRVVSELAAETFSFEGEKLDIVATAFALLETASRVRDRIALHMTAEDAPILILDESDPEVLCMTSPVRG